MRRSMVALCLLLVSPPSVAACWKDAPEQTGWLTEMPPYYASPAEEGADEATMFIGSMAGAGVASLALVVVSFRAFSRAADRGPMRPSAPSEDRGGDCGYQESRVQAPGLQHA